MAYKNKKKQKTHVKKIHELGLGNHKTVKSVKVAENEAFVVKMPANQRKMSFLERIVSYWM